MNQLMLIVVLALLTTKGEQPQNMSPIQTYRVRLQMVEVLSEEVWAYHTIPAMPVLTGKFLEQETQVRWNEEAPGDDQQRMKWKFQIVPFDNEQVTIHLAIKDKNSRDQLSFCRKIKIGEKHRVVISRDHEGIPLSWVNIEVQEPLPPTPVEVHPFLYKSY